MIEQIIIGMEFLNNQNISYMNLKPDNILIKKEIIKLVDYGIEFVNNEKINHYMSPELFKN